MNKQELLQPFYNLLLRRKCQVYITNADIAYAEKKLGMVGKFTISEGDSDLIKQAKRERIEFIKNLQTIDVNAVPGSGKTTALLMKLVILESKMPFEKGRGILVISHTNAAIDEITSRLQSIAPKLFEYPNFVGTIQSFVNKFLAIPYYIQMFGEKVSSIDSDNYVNKIKNFIDNPWLYKSDVISKEDFKKIFHLRNVYPKKFFSFRFFNKDSSVILVDNLNGTGFDIKKPNRQRRGDYSEEEKKIIYNWFFEFKKRLLEEGVLHYDDAYFLANRYIIKHPIIKKLLQERFKYVFVDEMQDMEKHQHDLLEEIFADIDNVIYQRIGDTNQAIYLSVTADNIWNPRGNSLELQGSFRLSPETAEVVKYFGIDFHEIIGLRESYQMQGSEENIKPHILIYKTGEEGKVLEKYAELINEYKLSNLSEFTEYEKKGKNAFHAIGWVGKDKDVGKKHNENIKTFYPLYNNSVGKESKTINSLADYIMLMNSKSKTMKAFVDVAFEILNTVLRLQKVTYNDTKRPYTKTQLKRELYEIAELNIKNEILLWSRMSSNDKVEKIKEFILSDNFKSRFLQEGEDWSGNINDFLNKENDAEIQDIDTTKLNIYNTDGVNIKIGTVHSVKGATHMATLYMENFYGTGNNQHESTRLKEQMMGNVLSNKASLIVQSAKMVYVGFSRPTHLLCFAVNKVRCNDEMSNRLEDAGWKVVNC